MLKNDGAEAWDLGDGVLGLTFKTKANSIDPDVIAMLTQAAERAERDFRALVIANDGRALLRRREPVPRRHGGGAEGSGSRSGTMVRGLPERDASA